MSERTGLEIAVIGIAARFPGANDIDAYWENLKKGVESIHFFTREELQEAGIAPEKINNPQYVNAWGIIEGVENFDAPFFDYTPQEARMMDPQIRLFHEIAWAALEDAGYSADRYDGLIGLYAGAAPNGLWEIQSQLAVLGGSVDYMSSVILSDKDYLSVRVSYKLNLKGPSFPIYTACSTSLVAVHLASQGLIGGECDMALAGGVKVSYPKSTGYMYQDGMIYSPDGHCRAFDAEAKGTVAGDGAAAVVLKLLDNAIRDNDHIYAFIKSSAINNDGKRKVGFAAPSVTGQVDVIKAALRMAEIPLESIGYIETHGTATPMGDPIEIEALKMVFTSHPKKSCPIGSVKSNIGHIDAAAGAAGFIKTVLALKYKLLPPSLHFNSPNPEIDFENTPFYVNTKLIGWKPTGDYPLRAGVSSFGIGGTNAHVILEESPADSFETGQEPAGTDLAGRECELLLLSARSAPALDRMTRNLADFIKKKPGINLPDVAYTLQVGRGEFEHRRMIVCSDNADAIEAMELNEDNSFLYPDRLKTAVFNYQERKPVFLFPGQGGQYKNMGRDLYRSEPVFKQEMDRCFDILKKLTGYDVQSLLYPLSGEGINGISKQEQENKHDPNPDTGPIQPLEIVQPIIFAFEYALAKLLLSWGIHPHAMIGYSFGEYAAACLAGVFSPEDALKLAAFRGKITAEQPEGAMLSVPLTEEELMPLLAPYPGISLAVVNEPACIVAGPPDQIAQFEKQLKQKFLICIRVPVSQALHSVMVEPVLDRFEQQVRQCRLNAPVIPFISSTTGQWVDPAEITQPGYWRRHLRDTVRFSRGAVKLIHDLKRPVFIEVGPGRDLTILVKRYIDEKAGHYAVNLVGPKQREFPDHFYLLNGLGWLWMHGVRADWPGYYKDRTPRRISLPTYPFDKYYYWLDTKILETIVDFLMGKEASPLSASITSPIYENVETPGMDTSTASPQRPPELTHPYASPQNESHHLLVNLWRDYFGFPLIGIDDDFFELGGDSLKAISMVNRVHRLTDVKIPIDEFFKHPNIRVLSQFMEKAERHAFISIKPAEKKEYYPLSPAQKRMFILHQMGTGHTGYNMNFAVDIQGHLDDKRLKQTVRELIERHESLRTCFIILPGENEPVQWIRDASRVDFSIEYFQEIDREHILTIVGSFSRSFDLSRPPLLRVGLIEQNTQHYILMVDLHHIITDGTSNGIFIKDFVDLYQGRDIPPLIFQYSDYCQWLMEDGKALIAQEKDYWMNRFTDEIPLADLPYDFARPTVQEFQGETLKFNLDNSRVTSLKKLARRHDATLFMVMLALFNILISKLTGQEDIIVGTPVIGRRHTDLLQIFGMFINTLALRNVTSPGSTFLDFLDTVKDESVKTFENQGYPFEDLVEQLTGNGVLQRDASRNPIFDLFLSFENAPTQSTEKIDFTLKPIETPAAYSLFDLSLYCREVEDFIACRMEYSTALFKRETINRFIEYFTVIVSAVADNPTIKICDIEIITPGEKQHILESFCSPFDPIPGIELQSVIERFEDRSIKSPDAVALCGDIVTHHLSYGFLNERADRVAKVLEYRGILPDSIVAVMIERSIEFITGILGILKVGAGYCPIDTDYPQDRIEYTLKDSDSSLVMTPAVLNEIIVESEKVKTPFDKDDFHHRRYLSNVAYVIYTSGSTGKPKGVMVEQRTLANLIEHQYRHTAIAFSRVMQFAAITFDVSTQEIFSTLGCGGTLFIIPSETRREVPAIFDFVSRHRVETLFFPTALLKVIMGDDTFFRAIPSFVSHIIAAGEQLVVNSRFMKYARGRNILLHNHYGPTETHVVTFYTLDCSPGTTVIPPIGKPLSNSPAFILDKAGYFQPVGIGGELLIGGVQVARGYLNKPELTAERFILKTRTLFVKRVLDSQKLLFINNNSNESFSEVQPRYVGERLEKNLNESFSEVQPHCVGERLEKNLNKSFSEVQPHCVGERLEKNLNKSFYGVQGRFLQKEPLVFYRTGDFCRWLPDGNIEFLGRMDRQVKIRGFRIEVGEIESRLVVHPRVHDAVVMDFHHESGEKYLIAYAAIDEEPGGALISSDELKEFLSCVLPEYMIPSRIILLEKIPLTSNGKVDKRVLAVLREEFSSDAAILVRPQNPIEMRLARLWAEVLSIPFSSVGIDRNFFQTGGHSLRATVLVSKIRKEFEIKISLADIFRFPTIRALALYFRTVEIEKFIAIEPVEEKEYYILSSAQNRIYVLSCLEENSITYNMAIIVTIQGILDREKLENAFSRLIRRQEILRTYFLAIRNEPYQVVIPADRVHFGLEYFDLRSSPQLVVSVVNNFIRPFRLSQPPLCRVGLVRWEQDSYALAVDMHHIITDGTSLGIIIKELLAFYAGDDLPPLRLQYRDFVVWQDGLRQNKAAGTSIKAQEEYWIERFSGNIPQIKLPVDFPRPSVLSFEGSSVNFEIDEMLTSKIKQLEQETGATIFMIVLAVYTILLSKYSMQDDIIIGSGIAGRRHADLENIVGMFINMLPMRNFPLEKKSFSTFLSEVGQNALDAFENQEYQFEELVDRLNIPRDPGRNPIFDVEFTFQNIEMMSLKLEFPGVVVRPFEGVEARNTKFDLVLHAAEVGGRLFMVLTYSTALFKHSTVEEISRHFIEVFRLVLSDKDILLGDIVLSHRLTAATEGIDEGESTFGF